MGSMPREYALVGTGAKEARRLVRVGCLPEEVGEFGIGEVEKGCVFRDAKDLCTAVLSEGYEGEDGSTLSAAPLVTGRWLEPDTPGSTVAIGPEPIGRRRIVRIDMSSRTVGCHPRTYRTKPESATGGAVDVRVMRPGQRTGRLAHTRGPRGR